MPAASNVAQAQSEIIHRSVRLRLLPESLQMAHQLAGTAGACRFVWNYFLARTQQEYAAYQAGTRAQAPRVTFFSLGKDFTALRSNPRYAWLQEYSFREVRYVLKYLGGRIPGLLSGHAGLSPLPEPPPPAGWVHHP